MKTEGPLTSTIFQRDMKVESEVDSTTLDARKGGGTIVNFITIVFLTYSLTFSQEFAIKQFP